MLFRFKGYQRSFSSFQLSLSKLNEAGKAPIHTAVLKNDIDELEELLELSVDLNMPDRDGYTALHHAATGNQLEIFKLLLTHGAEPYIADRYGNTPAHIIAEGDYPDLASILIKQCPHALAFKNKNGLTATDIASHYKSTELKTCMQHPEPRMPCHAWQEPSPISRRSKTSSSLLKALSFKPNDEPTHGLQPSSIEAFDLMTDMDELDTNIAKSLIGEGFRAFSERSIKLKKAHSELSPIEILIDIGLCGFRTSDRGYCVVDFQSITELLCGLLRDMTPYEIIAGITKRFDNMDKLQQLACIYCCSQLLSIERLNPYLRTDLFGLALNGFIKKIKPQYKELASQLDAMKKLISKVDTRKCTRNDSANCIDIDVLLAQIKHGVVGAEHDPLGHYEVAVKGFAQDLKLISAHYMLKFSPKEWLKVKEDGGDDAVPVQYLFSFGHKLSNMVIFDMLNAEGDDAIHVFAFYLHVARELVSQTDGLNDYNSFSKIIIGLNANSVNAQSIIPKLSSKDRALFQSYSEYVQIECNFTKLRTAMEGHIVDLDLVLKDFRAIGESNNKFVAYLSIYDQYKKVKHLVYNIFTLCRGATLQTDILDRVDEVKRASNESNLDELYYKNRYMIHDKSSPESISHWLAWDFSPRNDQVIQLIHWAKVNLKFVQLKLKEIDRKSLSKPLRRSDFYNETQPNLVELLAAFGDIEVEDMVQRKTQTKEATYSLQRIKVFKGTIDVLLNYFNHHDINISEYDIESDVKVGHKRRRAFSH